MDVHVRVGCVCTAHDRCDTLRYSLFYQPHHVVVQYDVCFGCTCFAARFNARTLSTLHSGVGRINLLSEAD
jgi:hypothetical protein